MRIMMYYELKKLYKSPLHILALCMIIIIPFVYGYIRLDIGTYATIHGETFTQVVRDGNENLFGWDALQKENELMHSLSGVMDDAWFKDKDQALANIKTTVNDDQLTMRLLLEQIQLLKPVTNAAVWNQSSFDENGDEFVYPAFMKDQMNNATFYYDSYKNWRFLTDVMSAFGILFMLYIGVIGALIFNNEYSFHMMDIISASNIGKHKTGTAKLLLIIGISIIIPLCAILLYTLSVWLIFGLSHPDVSLAILGQLTPFTFIDMYRIGICMMLLGHISVAVISMLCSHITTSNYVSCAIILIFIIFPFFLTIQFDNLLLMQLFPSFYIILENVCLHFPFINIGNHTLYYKDAATYVWSAITLCTILYILYRNRKYKQI